MKEKMVPRRQFLRLAWWGSAGLLVAQGLGASLAALYPKVGAGAFGAKFRIPLSQLPQEVGEIDDSYLSTGRFYLSRLPSGILVMYRRCTHLGCVVPWRADDPPEDSLSDRGRFNCPCHGGIYDRYGVVKRQPPPRPLDLFAAWVEGDSLIVDTGTAIQRSSFKEEQVVRL